MAAGRVSAGAGSLLSRIGLGSVPVEKLETLLTIAILLCAMLLAFAIRLFAVIRFESVIHEFDPYFNYRTTRYLVEEGAYAFHNWFDDRAWYPLGRIVGGTIYPGLMATASVLYHALHALHISIDIREVCVFLAPTFSSITVLVTYLFTKELRDRAAGLMAAALVAIVPGYISRSVAGSYDNEAVAIFALIFTYYLWVKAVKTGSLMWSCLCTLSYFYMVSAWGGYVFIINLIPIHVLCLMITGRFSHRVYVAYSTFYALGTALSMQIAFVGFQPVLTSEHMGALGVFGLCQLFAFANYLRARMSADQFNTLFRSLIVTVGGLAAVALAILTLTGKIAPWTGRFYSLLDPTYAKDHIPIIASVSEHQPTTWSSFFFDLQWLSVMFPVGLYYCFKELDDAKMFAIIYGTTSIYFAGVMVRLMLVLSPIACVLGGIGLSATLLTHARSLEEAGSLAAAPGAQATAASDASRKEAKRRRDKAEGQEGRQPLALFVVALISAMLFAYVFHCTWVTSSAYSSPSIVLSANSIRGDRIIFDDFREAYYWLRMNTAEDARVMSWWDYGYQITGMANRTILVDNNTWNNTHIAMVGRAMASSEDRAYPIMQALDVDYVLVIFGGMIGYASDDINKFLWMVRIGGGVFPEIQEKDFLTSGGEYRIDSEASSTMLNCLMYKLCYYRFGETHTEGGKPSGYDRVRGAEIGNKDFQFDTLEEAYTTEHWLVRIYRVKKLPNRGY